MTAVYLDPSLDHDTQRERVYAGDVIVFSPTSASLELAAFARELVEEAFAPFDPTMAQHDMSVERFVETFAPLKPRFIHHERTLRLLKAIVAEHGYDLDQTYVDVPRLRGVTSNGYLTSGVGFAHHPHRDTWYSAPLCQLNWWMALYPFESESSMAFHLRYMSKAVSNGSSDFDYYEWNSTGRAEAAKHIHSDTRKQPTPEEPVELDPQLRVVCPPGGIVLFSGAQLHSTVPNTSGSTRFSIDFRTVNIDDLVVGRAAPNVDSSPRGTSLRDFVRASDFAPMPDDVVARYDVSAGGDTGVLVYRPSP